MISVPEKLAWRDTDTNDCTLPVVRQKNFLVGPNLKKDTIEVLFKRTSIVSFLILLAFVCADGSGSLLAQEDAWRARFLKEGAQGWDKYCLRAKRLQGSCLFSASDASRAANRPEYKQNQRFEFKQRPGCALYLEETLGEDNRQVGEGWLRVVNPRYGFELYRRKGNDPWAVSRVGKNVQWGALESPSKMAEFYTTLPCTFGTANPRLGQIPKDAGFALERVLPVERDGKTLAQVQFAYQPETPDTVPLRDGWALYDPDHYWVIDAFDVKMEYKAGKGTLTAANEYDNIEAGFPVLKRSTLRLILPGILDRNIRYEFDLHEGDVPESDFTLSAFGFPEPVGLEKAPFPWYLYVALAAVVCLGISALFGWLARRRRAA